MIKNTASQKWRVFAFDRTDNTPVTGDAANITAKISKDHAAAAAITDTNPTEVEDGFYDFDLSQAETNGNVLHILPESSTSNVQVIGVPGIFVTVSSDYASTVGSALTSYGASTFDPATDEVDVGYVEGTDATDYFDAMTSAIRSGLAMAAKMLAYFRIALRSDSAIATDDATELAEINADSGTGAGDYGSGDSNEGIRDQGDVYWKTSATITVTGGIAPEINGNVFIVDGDDYYDTEGRKFSFASEGWPDLTDATVTFRAKLRSRTTATSSFFNAAGASSENDYIEVEMDIDTAGAGEQTISIEIPAAASDLIPGTYFYHIRAVLDNGHKITLVKNEQGMIVSAEVEDED